MLTITLSATDDEPEIVLHLEHSLASLSKWEANSEEPFFKREEWEKEKTDSYIHAMILGEIPNGNWTVRLTAADYAAVSNYINSKQTATWFREDPNQRTSREVVTSELIYYWLIQFNIPFEPCETWHLNRLMTLIKICGIKQTKPKPMSRKAQAEEMQRLNALRRQQLGTPG